MSKIHHNVNKKEPNYKQKQSYASFNNICDIAVLNPEKCKRDKLAE